METVEPIRPELAPVLAADPMLERLTRQYAKFVAEYGQPVAIAAVFQSADGTTSPTYRTSPGVGGWRSFLALAGAMLTELALKPD